MVDYDRVSYHQLYSPCGVCLRRLCEPSLSWPHVGIGMRGTTTPRAANGRFSSKDPKGFRNSRLVQSYRPGALAHDSFIRAYVLCSTHRRRYVARENRCEEAI